MRELHSARRDDERCFRKCKPFRAIATHYDKTQCNVLAGVHLAASAISPT